MTWPTKKLGEVCDINMGQSPSSSTYNKNKNGLPFYQGKKDYGEIFPTPRVWCSEPIKIVEAGDILISVRAPVGALNIAQEKSCIGRGLTGLRAKKELDQDFLFIFLKLKEKDIANLGTGSTFTAISKKHLENIEIPLPPIGEQKKIVAKLEKLLAKTKEAKRLRAEAQEAAQNLLSAELHKIFEEGIKKGWEEKMVDEISDSVQYGYTASARTKGNSQLLRITDIQNGAVNWGNVPFCECEELGKYKLQNGDIVFARTGATVGKSYLLKNPPGNAIFASYLIRVKTNPKKCSPELLYYFFQSLDYWNQITGHSVGGAQPNVNGSKLKKIKIFLPSIVEQKKIVTRLDALSEKIRHLHEYQKSTQSDLVELEQSILHSAFRGK